MAQKRRQRTETAARHDLVRLCAFVALVVAALFFLVGGILTKYAPLVGTILNFIASLALLVAIAFPAWEFVRGKRKAWRIVYFVALVVYIAGAVLGLAFGL